MTSGMEENLVRLLHGELAPDEARELRGRIRREPELAEAWRRLERTWRDLEPPPPSAAVPPGFASRVMAHVRSQERPGSLSWSAAPGWVRAAAAAALVAGAALGIGVGRSLPASEASPARASVSVSNLAEEDDSLAGSYWSVVEDATGSDTEEAMP
jgi:anti-sigma-K factor RskA